MRRGATICAVLAAAALAAGSAGASSTTYITFKTPSGNIGCAYSKLAGEKAGLRCEILSGLKPRPPKPKTCHAEWGRAVGMTPTGKASRFCISDTVIDPGARVLAYGKTWKRSGFSCTSRTTGLTCKNTSGHGWFMSRALSRLF
jgi:hypothetical protein